MNLIWDKPLHLLQKKYLIENVTIVANNPLVLFKLSPRNHSLKRRIPPKRKPKRIFQRNTKGRRRNDEQEKKKKKNQLKARRGEISGRAGSRGTIANYWFSNHFGLSDFEEDGGWGIHSDRVSVKDLWGGPMSGGPHISRKRAGSVTVDTSSLEIISFSACWVNPQFIICVYPERRMKQLCE
ncbi:hypothetical protein CDAR_195011 [Caerostris darwini]|uniref:Uncharacterized protein n=1 Tax=Caerostris darwini TaxID=1538125 RepID=A0AAV4X9B1_9ARAC|nr:hypothetical protein CDAR_195011 [Caerostris darwini]